MASSDEFDESLDFSEEFAARSPNPVMPDSFLSQESGMNRTGNVSANLLKAAGSRPKIKFVRKSLRELDGPDDSFPAALQNNLMGALVKNDAAQRAQREGKEINPDDLLGKEVDGIQVSRRAMREADFATTYVHAAITGDTELLQKCKEYLEIEAPDQVLEVEEIIGRLRPSQDQD